ncbi:MAG: hypothetical protein COC15_01450 [Legionellales bacterium]|nr:MAG: hypothetical protein COC15_01450 [Legionellales bacterium]
MKLHHLKTFLLLAKNDCDFSVHTLLGISRSTMWAHITEIESEIDLKLINRRKQNTSFTEDGLVFVPYAEKIYATFEDGLAQMQAHQGKGIPGELAISTTKAVADGWLLSGMLEFSSKYPEININIVAEDCLSKNMLNSADIFLRPIGDIANITKKWGIIYNHGLFAGKDYLHNMGTPKSPEDLLQHQIISYGEQEFSYFDTINWHLKGKLYGLPKLTPTLSINSTSAIYTAAIAGLGICSAAIEANLIYHKDLLRVLPKIVGPVVKSHFCTRDGAGKHKQNNINLFQSYLEQHLVTLGVNIVHE